MELEERVRKTLALFEKNVKIADEVALSPGEKKVIELARMYASDALSFMKKGDYITAFSGVEYAHGLLDAVLKLNGKDHYETDK